jgi:hypothetical protein
MTRPFARRDTCVLFFIRILVLISLLTKSSPFFLLLLLVRQVLCFSYFSSSQFLSKCVPSPSFCFYIIIYSLTYDATARITIHSIHARSLAISHSCLRLIAAFSLCLASLLCRNCIDPQKNSSLLSCVNYLSHINIYSFLYSFPLLPLRVVFLKRPSFVCFLLALKAVWFDDPLAYKRPLAKSWCSFCFPCQFIRFTAFRPSLLSLPLVSLPYPPHHQPSRTSFLRTV